VREYLFVLIIAAAVTYLLTPLVRRGAIAVNAQHAPRARDVHTKPTPLLGGLAMYGGLIAGLLVANQFSFLQQAFGGASFRTIGGLLLAAGLVVLMGAVDDRYGLGVVSRLAGQVAAGGIIVWSGEYIPSIPWAGSVKSVILQPDISWMLTILIVVATINAVNFIDGLDGLAAGVVGISALGYLVYSYELTNSVGIPSQSIPAITSAVLAGVCFGFLPHNFSPARIFMGDAGAYLLGLLLAYGPISSLANLDQNLLVTYGSGHPANRFPTVFPFILPVVIWLIPYTDMVMAVIRRWLRYQSPFAADRQHLHHRLMNLGHSVRSTVLLMYLWAAMFTGLVVALAVIQVPLIWFAVVTVVAVAALIPATAPKLRWWHSAPNGPAMVGANGAVPVGTTAPDAESIMTSQLPAPAGKPVPNILPPRD
jgi:UDP-GlcNAc:undecaprenyl-phosphate GlcNAc-1-phosphate transferase